MSSREFRSSNALAAFLITQPAYQNDDVGRIVGEAEKTRKYEDADLRITLRDGVFYIDYLR